MQISLPLYYNSAYNNRINNKNRIKHNYSSPVAFKSVTPEHFFINVPEYHKDKVWGQFVVNLVNVSKKKVLEPGQTLRKGLFDIADKYKDFQKTFLGDVIPYGVAKTEKDKDMVVWLDISTRFKHFYPRCLKTLDKNKDNLMDRTLNNIFYKAFQPQKQVDKKNIVLTQIACCESYMDNNKKWTFLIHPPYKTANILINKSEKTLNDLRKYKGKKLNDDDINKIYKKIGSIHWCLAQGMPFIRGSAAIADIYTKSLFEALNIQTTPWRQGIAPDWEAFFTPHDDYAKRYRSFFESKNKISPFN